MYTVDRLHKSTKTKTYRIHRASAITYIWCKLQEEYSNTSDNPVFALDGFHLEKNTPATATKV